MKTISFTIILFLITLILYGCIPSVHPLYTDDDLFFEPNILGTWMDRDNEVEWIFEDSGKSGYIARITDEGKLSNIDVHLIKLEDMYFFDFYPHENFPDSEISEYLSIQYFAVHTFSKVIMYDDSLEILRFDASWFEEMLKSDPTLLKHEITSNNILLTASTHELQRFILDYAEVDEAYTDKEMLYRKQ